MDYIIDMFVTVVPLSQVENYIIAKMDNIWGIKSKNMKEFNLRKGDKMIFVIGVHCLSEPSPKGFPRLKTYEGVDIQVEELWHVELTSDPTFNENSPFGGAYPWTFDFEILESKHDFPLTELNSDLIETVRKLFTGRRKFIPVMENILERKAILA